MKQRGFTTIVLVIIVVIVSIIVVDFLGDRPDRRGGNPFALNVEDYEPVDESWIHYRESGRIDLGDRQAGGFAVFGDEIYITGKDFLQIIRADGMQKLVKEITEAGTCIAVNRNFVFIGFHDHVEKYNHEGELISRFDRLGNRCTITSLALKENNLYVADAGNRRVLRYNLDGTFLGEFKGESESSTPHGFIVPSPNFDLVVNGYGELWVVNPGIHAIENYTDDGRLRGYWQSGSMDLEGFLGCCNPAEIAVTADGSFVTSEKGLVRIKIHDASGRLVSVVAAPEQFREEGQAPEVAVDETGNILALDFDENMIRIFEKKPAG